MEFFLQQNSLLINFAIGLGAVLLLLISIFTIVVFIVLPVYHIAYDRFDRKGEFVTVQGRVIEKRYDSGLSGGVVVVVDGIMEHIQLPQELFRVIELDTTIDLKARYGRLSHRLLQVKPEGFQVDTFA